VRPPPHQIGTAGASDGDSLFYNSATDELEFGAPATPGIVDSIVAGANVTVDDTDPRNPIVSATGGGGSTYHGCAASRATSQSVTSAGAAVQLDVADEWDTDSIHDPATNNTRFTIPSGLGGFWRFSGVLVWASASTARGIGWAKNGTRYGAGYVANVTAASSTTLQQALSVDLQVTAGDYIECIALPNATVNVTAARVTCSYLGA
jgi:hypothetical protein